MPAQAPIRTLTLNPALDTSFDVAHVEPDHKLRTSSPTHEAGGGGLNVARVVQELGGDVHATFTAGGFTGGLLVNLVRGHDLPCTPIPIDGTTRENVIARDATSGRQYRFVLPGPDMSPAALDAAVASVLDGAQGGFVVLSGSLPGTADADTYARIAREAHALDIKVVVDTSGEPLRRACREGVHAIKPNFRELGILAGRHLESDHDVEAAAHLLVEECGSDIVLVSLGAGGALLVDGDGTRRIPAPAVPVVSHVGAGDSTTAAMTLALARGRDVPEAARYGVAAGAAAVMTPGTQLARREDVERLFKDMMSSA